MPTIVESKESAVEVQMVQRTTMTFKDSDVEKPGSECHPSDAGVQIPFTLEWLPQIGLM